MQQFSCLHSGVYIFRLGKAFVKQSVKQLLAGSWARSWVLPEIASFRNIEIPLFCSRIWVVLAVDSKFFASVLKWMFATSLEMSINYPRRYWREPKHFMEKVQICHCRSILLKSQETSGKYVATWKLYSTLQTFLSVLVGFCTLCIERALEVFLRVSFRWDFLQLIKSLLLADCSARHRLGILCRTNSLSCKG